MAGAKRARVADVVRAAARPLEPGTHWEVGEEPPETYLTGNLRGVLGVRCRVLVDVFY